MTQDFIYKCSGEKDTQNLAKTLSKISQPGDVWALQGTLGMGKSVFARAFIKECCNVEDVPSPTFTLVQTYETPDFEIYHYDLYRLKSPEEIWELNIEEAMAQGVCLIEWPEKMGSYLPRDIFKVDFSADISGERTIRISVKSEKKALRLSGCQRPVDE